MSWKKPSKTPLLLSTDSSSAVVSRLRHRPIEAAAFIATVKLLGIAFNGPHIPVSSFCHKVWSLI
jgi:hypothetical protein